MKKFLLPLVVLFGSCAEQSETNYSIVRKEYPNGIILSETPNDNQTDWYVIIGDAYYKVVVSGNQPRATLLVTRHNPMIDTPVKHIDTPAINPNSPKKEDSLIVK